MRREFDPRFFSSPNSETPSIVEVPLKQDRGLDRSEIRRIEDLISSSAARIQDHVKTLQLKMERHQSRLGQLEAKIDHVTDEMRTKYAQLSGRITERAVHQDDVASLIDRQNQMVRAFETRLQSLQKVIETQQAQMFNYKAALDESRRELVRLKQL